MIKNTIKGWLQLARPPLNAHKYEKIEFDKSIEYAIDAVEKEFIYRWHYLEKSGAELPTVCGLIIVKYYLWRANDEYETDYCLIDKRGDDWFYCIGTGQIKVNWEDVIAWRYIEEVEE